MTKKSTERAKKWRRTHPEYFKTEKFKLEKLNNSLKYKYEGFSLQAKRELFVRQQGRCPLCGLALPEPESPNCCVDHDHVKNTVRGLLHKACNVWLGFIEKHGKVVLSRVSDYLSK